MFTQEAPEAVTTATTDAAATSTTAAVTGTAETAVVSPVEVAVTSPPQVAATVTVAAPPQPEWWQSALTPMGYVLAAIIAGAFAIRLARKTPHENLKALVEIRKTLDEDDVNLDEKGVLDAAIAHELDNIAALTAARGRGFWAYFWTAAKISFSREVFTNVLPIVAAMLVAAALGWLA